MQASDFTDDCPGLLRSVGAGLDAFVPDPVPRRLLLPPRLEILASEAERLIGRFGGMLHGGGSPLNPHLVGRPLLRREAIESSRIEGTFTTPEQLALLDSEDGEVSEASDDTREVQNYLLALDWAMQELPRLPISQRMIRGIHERLMRGVRGDRERPGDFRTVQNFIGRSQNPAKARFVPPPVEELPRLLKDLEEFIHEPAAERQYSRLIRLALVHFQFETIHPFQDGNGRVGRILIPLLICSEQPDDPPLYLSPYFEARRNDYYDSMLAVSQRGAFADWIEFFLTGVQDSTLASIEVANALFVIRQEYLTKAQSKRWPGGLLKVIDALFEAPVLTIRRVETLAEVSTPTASDYLKRLEAADIVSEVTGKARNRKYMAVRLLNAVHRRKPKA
jgi:Fic family protein